MKNADNSMKVTGYEGTSTDVVIPETIDGCYVTSIESSAFATNEIITSVVISDRVTSIGMGAFCACNELASVTIGSGVTSIGGQAFAYCMSLNNITFNGTTTEWKSISKYDEWSDGILASYVQCSDGTVSI